MRLLILMLLISSCSTLPQGEKVMKQMIEQDKRQYLKKKQLKATDDVEDFLTIYIHPQVVQGNILLKQGVYLVPVKKKSKGWDVILKEK